ncbi:MAG: xylulokinase [Planctomycetes bacterium]|nr:xylulokinase [Planctomycetota bacterium]
MGNASAYFLGLDVGTQGTKAIVLDAERECVVARAASSYGLIEGLGPGHAEQHPLTWLDAISAVLDQLGKAGIERTAIAAIGVSGQQHGFVPLDRDGAILRPAKLWCDTATAVEARELSQRLGRHVPTGFTASKILWLKRHEPERFARLSTVLLPHDYVNYVLTGRAVMEAGDASGTGFFDPAARAFDSRAIAAIDDDLGTKIPPLVGPGDVVGRVAFAGRDVFGLAESTLVATGGGDNMMSAIGSGATRTGVVVVSLGTSGTVFTRTERPLIDPRGLIAPFCDSAGAWLPLLCVMNSTGVTEEIRSLAGTEFDGDLGRLTRAAAAVEPGVGGALLLPYLNGERVPDLPEATGALIGIRPGTLRVPELFRLALEGTSLNLALGVDRMRALGVGVEAVRLVGGAAANPLWRSILAATLDAPVVRSAEPESAALGGAIQALWTWRRARGESISIDAVAAPYVRVEGDVEAPDPRLRACYREAKERFVHHAIALFGEKADPRG